MQVETKFLRLPIPVTLDSFFGDWRGCWLGGWSKHRLYYVVMVSRITPSETIRQVRKRCCSEEVQFESVVARRLSHEDR